MGVGLIYQYVYLILIIIFTIVETKTIRLPSERENVVGSFLMCLFMILFIGFRPISYDFGDMGNYDLYWDVLANWHGWDWEAENIIFDNMFNFMADNGFPKRFFFVLVAFIYFGGMYVSCAKLFPNHIMLSFLVCLAAFSSFTYGTNGIKAGAAASLFLVALAFRDIPPVSILFLLLSWGFHHSMQMPVAAYVLTLFFKHERWYFYGWLFCLAMAAGHVSFFQNLFAGMSDSSGAGYLGGEDQYNTVKGFRIDFVIYSAMPVVMGYYVKFKYKLMDKLYDVMLNMYLCTNGIWMLCMYANFTNRIAYLSWLEYPILLLYPCFQIQDPNHPLVVNRNKFIFYHLGFTVFMTVVYYH